MAVGPFNIETRCLKNENSQELKKRQAVGKSAMNFRLTLFPTIRRTCKKCLREVTQLAFGGWRNKKRLRRSLTCFSSTGNSLIRFLESYLFISGYKIPGSSSVFLSKFYWLLLIQTSYGELKQGLIPVRQWDKNHS